MSISKYGLLLFLLVVITVVGIFGGYAGYTVNGVPSGGWESEEPGLLGLVDWVWNAIVFMFVMVTFQVDNMPVFISAIFLVMSFMTVFLIVSLIRGSD